MNYLHDVCLERQQISDYLWPGIRVGIDWE